MLPMVHLKDEVDSVQVPTDSYNLLHDAIQIAKHTVIGTLQLCVDYQDLHNLKICHLKIEKTWHCFTLYSAKCKINMFLSGSEYT